jgi:hypothetical protein
VISTCTIWWRRIEREKGTSLAGKPWAAYSSATLNHMTINVLHQLFTNYFEGIGGIDTVGPATFWSMVPSLWEVAGGLALAETSPVIDCLSI